MTTLEFARTYGLDVRKLMQAIDNLKEIQTIFDRSYKESRERQKARYRMQIVIDIDENLYTRLFDNGDTDAVDMLKACVAIRKGTPLQKGHCDVLDKIRAEIKEWYWQADKQAIAKDPCVVDAMVDLFIRTIDKYEAENEKEADK